VHALVTSFQPLTVDFTDTDGASSSDLKTLHELQAVIASAIISLVLSSVALITALARRRAATMGLIFVAFVFSILIVAIYGDVYSTLKGDISLGDDDSAAGLSVTLSTGFYLSIVTLVTRYAALLIVP
jgi:hypothetical protein